jgi:hypothetical protein
LCFTQDALKAAAAEDAAASAAARARGDQLMADAEVAAAERLMTAAQLELGSALEEERRISTAVNRVSAVSWLLLLYAPHECDRMIRLVAHLSAFD